MKGFWSYWISLLCFVVVFLREANGYFLFNFKDINFYSHDPDISRNVSELITSKGYPVENYVTQTKDGFILSLQRIPHGRTGSEDHNKVDKPVVFLQHGLLSAASDWVINFPEQSLGFILSDAGYDVWMGNTRGNTYSRKHVKYTPDMAAFWNFSFDEMAEFDLPAMIDFVLNATGHDQLYYVGHSQGTAAAFALLSKSPEYNDKMKLFVAMAPVTTVGSIKSAIKYLAPFTSEVEYLFWLLGYNEFLPSDGIMKYLSQFVCNTEVKFLCENVLFLLAGADSKQLNTTRLGVYTAHLPAGSSTKSIVHFAQMVNSKKFTKYDYGKDNMKQYNQTTPPEYDVSNITTPVALLWSLNDALADPTDVVALQPKLKSLVSSYCVSYSAFNHEDFVMAEQANTLVYQQVLELLRKY
jgi:lysosomal acid lipase/cholesteryl ester hydrolase